MKLKIFKDYRFPIGIIGIVGIGSAYAFCLYMMRYLIEGFHQKTIDLITFISVMMFYAIISVWIIYFFRYLSKRTLSWLIVTQNMIIWQCPFHFTVKMKLDNCLYIGVEDMADNNRMIPVAHENEVAYIYFSNEAFPSTYKHKIDKLKCKKNFIKFAYSDKLCECLTNIFPQDKVANLISFYNRMQAQNRIAKRKKKKKSR